MIKVIYDLIHFLITVSLILKRSLLQSWGEFKFTHLGFQREPTFAVNIQKIEIKEKIVFVFSFTNHLYSEETPDLIAKVVICAGFHNILTFSQSLPSLL